jgi:hypothetical protein
MIESKCWCDVCTNEATPDRLRLEATSVTGATLPMQSSPVS